MSIITIPVGAIGTNCYVLYTKSKNCVVVDPGAQPDKILTRIDSEGLSVRYILLTHGHYDHIGGVKRLMERFPEAKLCIGKNDMEMLTDSSKSYANPKSSQSDSYFLDKVETVSDDRIIEIDELKIRVIETPGHTKGGVCYVCGDSIFSGDTLFFRDVGRCDLYGGDYEVLKKSLLKLVALDGDYRVYPGHGDSTSLDFERQHNMYIAEAMA